MSERLQTASPALPGPQLSAAREALLLSRAVDALRRGRMAEAQHLLKASTHPDELLDEAFSIFHAELDAQAQQLRDDEARAARGHDWFATLFRALPVASLLLDRHLTITRSNVRAEQDLGLSGQARGRSIPLRRLLASGDDELLLLAGLKEGTGLHLEAVALRSPSGRSLQVELHLCPTPPSLVGGEHEEDAYLCLVIDRTERLALQRAQERIAQTQRAREVADAANLSKSQMLSRVSHELRTPLNAVLGFAQMLLLGGGGHPALSTEQQVWVSHIQRAGEQLLALVEEVLDINQAESGTLRVQCEALHLDVLVREALAQHAPAATLARLQLHFEPGPDDVLTQGDPVRCIEVIDNLLSNAIKYTPAGGHITVRITASAATVALAVEDTGLGLGPDQMAHLFEPFNRLGAESRKTPGRGLGLHLARALARAMGGDLHCDSVPGAGSVFTLGLRRWR